jgi:hypothetical protein
MVSRHAQENKETAPGNPGAVGPGLLTLAGCLQRTPRTPFKLWRSAVNRVAVYVDGFNLYYGLRTRHGRQHLWLDLQALAASLLRPGQVLQRVTYFTARVRDNPDALQRQADYLDALSSHSPLVRWPSGRESARPGNGPHRSQSRSPTSDSGWVAGYLPITGRALDTVIDWRPPP